MTASLGPQQVEGNYYNDNTRVVICETGEISQALFIVLPSVPLSLGIFFFNDSNFVCGESLSLSPYLYVYVCIYHIYTYTHALCIYILIYEESFQICSCLLLGEHTINIETNWKCSHYFVGRDKDNSIKSCIKS